MNDIFYELIGSNIMLMPSKKNIVIDICVCLYNRVIFTKNRYVRQNWN